MASQTRTAELTRTPQAVPALCAEDVALASRCVAGEADAISQMYQAHLTAVRGMARLHASDPAMAEDLVHDAFVRALELMPRYRGEAPLGVWIRGIAFNLARTERRRSARRSALLRTNALPPAQAPAPDDRSALATLDRLMMRLPETERDAFCLRSVQRLSLEEVAELLGTAVSTVSDRDRRAKAKLRTWMKGES